ncbi:MAG: hypothetical protein ACLFUF_07725, partial [Opitutales bacterium]
ELLYRQCRNPETHSLVEGVLVPLAEPETYNPCPAAFILEASEGAAALPAFELAAEHGFGYSGGIRLFFDDSATASPLGLPVYGPAGAVVPGVESSDLRSVDSGMPHLHAFASGTKFGAFPSRPGLHKMRFHIERIEWAAANEETIPENSEEALAVLLKKEADAGGMRRTAKEVAFLGRWLSSH